MIASDPWQGGATWAVLQYVLGLRKLGHDVFLIEPIAGKALRPEGSRIEDSENAAYFKKIVCEFNLQGSSALLLNGTKETVGVPYEGLRTFMQSADLLLNISGLLTDRELTGSIGVRVYLDLDPAFNQLWNAAERLDMRFGGHTHFLTIGQAIGDPECSVPSCGLNWIGTFQPVVLEHWPVSQTITHDALTTVANWRGYGSIEHEGRHYGQKAHSLRQFMDLPRFTDERFLLALAIHPGESKDVAALAAHGWHLLDPARVARCPATYQSFIQGSKAEFGIAKSGYVVSRCGWFSDRSICYLASGRPVIAQETGFSKFLPTGEGLFNFQNREEVLGAIEKLRTEYPRHARQARAIAEEYFDSNKVLNHLLDQVSA